MTIFNSYVSLPEGKCGFDSVVTPWLLCKKCELSNTNKGPKCPKVPEEFQTKAFKDLNGKGDHVWNTLFLKGPCLEPSFENLGLILWVFCLRFPIVLLFRIIIIICCKSFKHQARSIWRHLRCSFWLTQRADLWTSMNPSGLEPSSNRGCQISQGFLNFTNEIQNDSKRILILEGRKSRLFCLEWRKQKINMHHPTGFSIA